MYAYITLHKIIVKMLRELRSLYIVSSYNLSLVEKMSFQPASENRKRRGGSDVLWKLVPDRNDSDDESEVANRRTSGSRND